MTTWPDTSSELAPRDPYAAAVWLLGRHPRLAQLVDRIPDLVDRDVQDDTVVPTLDMTVLADALTGAPVWAGRWGDYVATQPEPAVYDDAVWEMWEEAGPKPSPALGAFLPMSSGEQGMLRLFAVIGSDRVPFCLADVRGWDAAGQAFLDDWRQVVAAR